MIKYCCAGIGLLHRKLVSDSNLKRKRSCIKRHKGLVGVLRT